MRQKSTKKWNGSKVYLVERYKRQNVTSSLNKPNQDCHANLPWPITAGPLGESPNSAGVN